MDSESGGFAEFPAKVIFGDKKFLLKGIQGDFTSVITVQVQDNGFHRIGCKIGGGEMADLINQVQNFCNDGFQDRNIER